MYFILFISHSIWSTTLLSKFQPTTTLHLLLNYFFFTGPTHTEGQIKCVTAYFTQRNVYLYSWEWYKRKDLIFHTGVMFIVVVLTDYPVIFSSILNCIKPASSSVIVVQALWTEVFSFVLTENYGNTQIYCTRPNDSSVLMSIDSITHHIVTILFWKLAWSFKWC